MSTTRYVTHSFRSHIVPTVSESYFCIHKCHFSSAIRACRGSIDTELANNSQISGRKEQVSGTAMYFQASEVRSINVDFS